MFEELALYVLAFVLGANVASEVSRFLLGRPPHSRYRYTRKYLAWRQRYLDEEISLAGFERQVARMIALKKVVERAPLPPRRIDTLIENVPKLCSDIFHGFSDAFETIIDVIDRDALALAKRRAKRSKLQTNSKSTGSGAVGIGQYRRSGGVITQPLERALVEYINVDQDRNKIHNCYFVNNEDKPTPSKPYPGKKTNL